eukprot:13649784-Alexandrium_andersonii.AAC.1
MGGWFQPCSLAAYAVGREAAARGVPEWRRRTSRAGVHTWGGELMPPPAGTQHRPMLQDAGQGERVDPRQHLLP